LSFSKENPADIHHCVFAGNETFERLATFGLLANFMVYLMRVFHLEQVTAANVINIWSGVTNFAPLVGAFISDAYVGRFKTIAFASCAAFLVHFSDHFTLLSVHTVISSYCKIKINFLFWLLHRYICLCAVLISAITNEKEIYSFMYEFLDFLFYKGKYTF
jgi:dipeptide/tripeptide permease